MSDDPSIPDLQETPQSSTRSIFQPSSNGQSEKNPAAQDAAAGGFPDTATAGKGCQEFEFGEPAEVLVELAKRGEIDPWDIDIAKATEKFLQYIDSLEKRDLRIPARTLLYASILLRMKSDSMEGQKDVEPEPEMEQLEDEQEEEMEENLPRPPVRRLTKRPVTLDELISELKKAEMVGRRKAMRERWPTTEEKALDVSHDEGIEDRIKALGPILDDMFMETKTVSFHEINSKNSKTEDGVTNYVSLLFMAQRKQVWLEQEEIFGDLFVKRHA
jgi:segregation and condensation protein A